MTKPLKVMYFNPVGNSVYDQVFADMIAAHKLPNTEAHVTSLPPEQGAFTHIEYRSYEAIVTRGIIRATRAASKEGFDAFVIGCFYDTALHDAREISGEMIVTAPCMASVEIATSLANTFGVIVGRRKWVDQMQRTVTNLVEESRLAGFEHVGLGVDDFQKDHACTEELLTKAGRRLVEDRYAESLVLGCTLEIGFHKSLEQALGVPVIDPSIAAFKRAEYGALLKHQCGWIPSRMWSCEAPPEEEIARIGGFDDGEIFGNRVIVKADPTAKPIAA